MVVRDELRRRLERAAGVRLPENATHDDLNDALFPVIAELRGQSPTEDVPEGGGELTAPQVKDRSTPTARRVQQRARNVEQRLDTIVEGLVEGNIGLVKRMATSYRASGRVRDDVVAEATAELVAAIHEYDHTRGARFSTYAHPRLKGAVNRAARSELKHQLSAYDWNHRAKVRKARDAFANEHGRQPSVDELVKETGFDPRLIRRCLQSEHADVSLNVTPSSDDYASPRQIADTQASFENSVAQLDLMERVFDAALPVIPARDRMVMLLHWGAGGEKQLPLREIGRLMGVSHTAAGNRVRAAVARLTHPATMADVASA